MGGYFFDLAFLTLDIVFVLSMLYIYYHVSCHIIGRILDSADRDEIGWSTAKALCRLYIVVSFLMLIILLYLYLAFLVGRGIHNM